MFVRSIAGVRFNFRCLAYPTVSMRKCLFRLLTSLVVVCIMIIGCHRILKISSDCRKIYMYDFLGSHRDHFICVSFLGRLGNQMFQYAFLYAYAKKKGLTMIIPQTDVTKAFGIQQKSGDQYGFSEQICQCFPVIEDDRDCAYEYWFERLEKNKDRSFKGFFQSWKYWKEYDVDLRKIFVFQDDIKRKASFDLARILKETGKNPLRAVLVGIHVRRGDHIASNAVKFGYLAVTDGYLNNAMNYFRRKYSDVLFVAISDDIPWTYNALKGNKDVYIVTGNTGEVDMCLLTMTNHTIMSVGTFGWFIGWMTNGTTIYFKNVARPGSDYEKQFGTGIHDHFFPHWIGME